MVDNNKLTLVKLLPSKQAVYKSKMESIFNMAYELSDVHGHPFHSILIISTYKVESIDIILVTETSDVHINIFIYISIASQK